MSEYGAGRLHVRTRLHICYNVASTQKHELGLMSANTVNDGAEILSDFT